MARVFRDVLGEEIRTPIPRIATGGDGPVRVDKPDTRFGLEITDHTALLSKTDFRVFAMWRRAGA